MMDKKIKELIDRQLDGLLSDAEQKRLADFLRQNPEAEKYFQDMKKMKTLLDQVPQVPAPTSLKASIMNSLDTGLYAQPPKKKFDFSAMGNWFNFFRLRPAYAFVLGVVLGALVISIIAFQIPGPANWPVSGTMKTVPQTIPIHASLAAGKIEWQGIGQQRLVKVRLHPKRKLVLQIEFDSQKLQLKSMASDPRINFSFAGDGNQLKIESQNALTISLNLLKTGGSPWLSVTLRADDKEIFHSVLNL